MQLQPCWEFTAETREVSFEPFVSFAPGRVCLFGEHQDYLGFPVIAAAIPLGCRLVVQPRTDGTWSFCTPRLGFEWSCSFTAAKERVVVPQPGPAAFLRAGLFEAAQAGWDLSSGGDVVCHVDLPLQAGLSSSSALVVAWMQALARVAGQELKPLELARWANCVEVEHFGEPGGHMDHVASALGGTLRIHPDWKVERLGDVRDGVWVVVDSGEPKDTRGHLTRCKTDRMTLVAQHGGRWCAPEELASWDELTTEEQGLWRATWVNQNLESMAAQGWSDRSEIPDWMTEHHAQLRDGLGLSTPRLEQLGEAAMSAGAQGWKVVGSGGGGCALAWVPAERASAVHEAVRQAGAAASWTVGPTRGAWCMSWQPPKFPAVVLAAGRSSRMKSLGASDWASWTQEQREVIMNRPKAMLPVGPEGRPFLACLIDRMKVEGVDDICVVLSAEDATTPELLEPWLPAGVRLDVTRQTILPGRLKPQGTADAVQRGLEAHPEWLGLPVAVFNGDNLPPRGAIEALRNTHFGTVAFARSALGLPPERVEAFAVFEVAPPSVAQRLIEKPTAQEVEAVADSDGEVWVSMNVFRLPYKSFLEGCREAPVHPDRQERELPTAVWLAAERSGVTLQLLPFRGAFHDLTHPSDWQDLTRKGVD